MPYKIHYNNKSQCDIIKVDDSYQNQGHSVYNEVDAYMYNIIYSIYLWCIHMNFPNSQFGVAYKNHQDVLLLTSNTVMFSNWFQHNVNNSQPHLL